MMPPSQVLVVNVVQAEGLQHLNHFTGDHPYCVCEVKHLDPHAPTTRAETSPVTEGDTINPVWNEFLELGSWQPGEALEFTIYDKGLIGSTTEGKAMLPSEFFHPNGFTGMISIVGLPDARLRVEVPPPAGAMAVGGQFSSMAVAASPVTYQAPMTISSPMGYPATVASTGTSSLTYAAPAPAVVGSSEFGSTFTGGPHPSQGVIAPTTYQAEGPQRLAVSILQAHGLKHLNHFTGDHPYVVCEVKRMGSSMETTKVETKPVTEGDSLNPFWGETFHLGPWYPGEPLEFTVYDKGLIGSKTEGKVVVAPELFYPNGLSGMVSISGLPHALLHVIIRPLGPMVAEGTTLETVESAVADATKKKRKKIKVGKKSKGCC